MAQGPRGARGPTGAVGYGYGIVGARGSTGDTGPAIYCKSDYERMNEKVIEQQNQIDQLKDTISQLTEAQNESRERIQALLDYCFTDRSAWKEGMDEKRRNKEGTENQVNGDEKDK